MLKSSSPAKVKPFEQFIEQNRTISHYTIRLWLLWMHIFRRIGLYTCVYEKNCLFLLKKFRFCLVNSINSFVGTQYFYFNSECFKRSFLIAWIFLWNKTKLFLYNLSHDFHHCILKINLRFCNFVATFRLSIDVSMYRNDPKLSS